MPALPAEQFRASGSRIAEVKVTAALVAAGVGTSQALGPAWSGINHLSDVKFFSGVRPRSEAMVVSNKLRTVGNYVRTECDERSAAERAAEKPQTEWPPDDTGGPE
jgi:hypothetical protein